MWLKQFYGLQKTDFPNNCGFHELFTERANVGKGVLQTAESKGKTVEINLQNHTNICLLTLLAPNQKSTFKADTVFKSLM